LNWRIWVVFSFGIKLNPF